jgi:hypothetical protein
MKLAKVLLILLLAGMFMSVLASTVGITVSPSVGPNGWGSANFPPYAANAVYALEHGLTSYGTPGTPSYYQQESNININQMIVTGFPSWLGQADPGTVFGAAYTNELGNRPLFGVVINGNGEKISISELGFTMSSNDPVNMLGFSFGTGSYNYSNDYVGVILDPGGPTFITGGPNTQLVDMIVGRGSGNADAAYCPAAPAVCDIAAQQAAIDALAPDFLGLTAFNGTYTMTSDAGVLATGSGTFNVGAAPEPAIPITLGSGLVALVILGRKRFARR